MPMSRNEDISKTIIVTPSGTGRYDMEDVMIKNGGSTCHTGRSTCPVFSSDFSTERYMGKQRRGEMEKGKKEERREEKRGKEKRRAEKGREAKGR